MSCASCAASVERVTKEMAGVLESSVNLATGKMTIHYEPEKIKAEEITEKIKGIGFTAELLSRDGKKATEQKAQAMPADEIGAKAIAAAILLSALLLYISMGPMLFPGIPMPDLISIGTHPVNYAIAQLLATIVVLFIGRKYFVSGF
jgi:Cu+-exporting ATPase